MLQATEDYRAEQDTVAGFLIEACVFGEDRRATKTNLYVAYVEHCDASGVKPVSKTDFGRRMRATEGVGEGKTGSAGHFWTGVGTTEG